MYLSCSFRRCGISTSLQGTDDRELNYGVVGAHRGAVVVCESCNNLIGEVLGLIFDSVSDVLSDSLSNKTVWQINTL